MLDDSHYNELLTPLPEEQSHPPDDPLYVQPRRNRQPHNLQHGVNSDSNLDDPNSE